MSIYPAKLIREIGAEIEGVETILLDPIDFNMPADGNDDENKDPKYTEITEKADAFFIVAPEYNHSFSGTLKRFLDSELKNYIHKPVAFAGVSSGPWGGVRAIEALVSTVREMGLIATHTDVQFPIVKDIFDSTTGKLKDEKYNARIRKAYDELIWMAKVLKWREETTIFTINLFWL
jgi:NAD(P)H-dependent FMN reductase